jgi:hypothetical protein
MDQEIPASLEPRVQVLFKFLEAESVDSGGLDGVIFLLGVEPLFLDLFEGGEEMLFGGDLLKKLHFRPYP